MFHRAIAPVQYSRSPEQFVRQSLDKSIVAEEESQANMDCGSCLLALDLGEPSEGVSAGVVQD